MTTQVYMSISNNLQWQVVEEANHRCKYCKTSQGGSNDSASATKAVRSDLAASC